MLHSMHCRCRSPGTHVAVGFADLGELAETLAAHYEGDTQGTSQPGLKWAGLDTSVHACAKAMVLLHKLKVAVHPSSAAQVLPTLDCLQYLYANC